MSISFLEQINPLKIDHFKKDMITCNLRSFVEIIDFFMNKSKSDNS